MTMTEKLNRCDTAVLICERLGTHGCKFVRWTCWRVQKKSRQYTSLSCLWPARHSPRSATLEWSPLDVATHRYTLPQYTPSASRPPRASPRHCARSATTCRTDSSTIAAAGASSRTRTYNATRTTSWVQRPTQRRELNTSLERGRNTSSASELSPRARRVYSDSNVTEIL